MGVISVVADVVETLTADTPTGATLREITVVLDDRARPLVWELDLDALKLAMTLVMIVTVATCAWKLATVG